MDNDASSTRIAVIGAGYMGGGMAQVFAMSGYECVIADADAETAQRCLDRLVREAAEFEEQGLFPADSAIRVARHLSASDSVESAVADADYVAEVVPERPDIKADVLGRISRSCRIDAVIASNTSAIPIESLAADVTHAERFLGVHWMNPAPFVPGVELIASTVTSPEVLDYAERLVTGLGKTAVRVPDQTGFIANRLQYALFQEAARMVEEGLATPRQVDEVVSNSFGFRLPFFGPFAIADMAGLDVYAGGYESFARAYGDRFAVPDLLTDRVASGDHGLKTGGGFTGMDPDRIPEIVAYRNRAYAALAQLKRDLGAMPGSQQ